MARIEMLPLDKDAAQDGPLAGVIQHLDSIPNLYRVLANAPEMLKAWTDFAWPLRLNATTPRPIRELLILRGAQVAKTSYEWAHHVAMAQKAGIRQEKIDALESWRESSLFDERERVVLELAEEVTGGTGASADTVAKLRTLFNDGEVVELVLTASFYVCVGRILESFAVDLEPDYAGNRPQGW